MTIGSGLLVILGTILLVGVVLYFHNVCDRNTEHVIRYINIPEATPPAPPVRYTDSSQSDLQKQVDELREDYLELLHRQLMSQDMEFTEIRPVNAYRMEPVEIKDFTVKLESKESIKVSWIRKGELHTVTLVSRGSNYFTDSPGLYRLLPRRKEV